MSDVNLSRIRAATAREIVSALTRDGFVLIHQKGSHHRFSHSDGRQVTASFSLGSDTFLRKTLRSMIKIQARWTDEDLQRLGLS